jgi:twinkle protein
LWNFDSLNEASGKGQTLIITEGEFDALSWMTAGASYVVSVPNGAPGQPGQGDIDPRTDKQFGYLWRDGKLIAELDKFERIILSTDGDSAGLVLRDELALRLGRPRCWHVTYPEGTKDANDVLPTRGLDAMAALLNGARPIVPNWLVRFSDIPSRAARPRYTSGWSGLDKHLRIVPPELVVVSGKPGSGKSQWTLAFVANLARTHGLKGAILQFEDDVERNREDLLTYARSWHGQPQLGIAEDPRTWVDRMFLTISPSEDTDESVDFDLQWVHHAIEEAATRHGARWLLIDPWNEIEHLWRVNETETGYTNSALRQLKRLIRRYQIALIIVAHPSKGGGSKAIEDTTPYDISGSQAWFNKPDHVVWIFHEQEDELTTVKVCKSKDWRVRGCPGTVKMRFVPQRASFEFVE